MAQRKQLSVFRVGIVPLPIHARQRHQTLLLLVASIRCAELELLLSLPAILQENSDICSKAASPLRNCDTIVAMVAIANIRPPTSIHHIPLLMRGVQG